MKALIILFIGSLFTLFGGIFGLKKTLNTFTLLVLSIVACCLIYDNQFAALNLQNMLIFDRFSFVFSLTATLVFLFIVATQFKNYEYANDNIGEVLALQMMALCGLYCMVSFNNMVMLFLGIEILSIPLYVLAGSSSNNSKSLEASLKYFIMGAFATGFLLLGITLIYGATGTFDLSALDLVKLDFLHEKGVLMSAGILILTFAMAFKLSMAPFHFWTPDVYQGSPLPIMTFMSTVVKIAGVGAMIRLLLPLLDTLAQNWFLAMSIIIVSTMIIGNISAIIQKDFKRTMAYSSIAHIGYLALIFLVPNSNTASVAIYYLIAYAIPTVIILAIMSYLKSDVNADYDFEDFKTLPKQSPFLAVVLSIALLSLAGIPPLIGFVAKYQIFKELASNYMWLLIIAIINSAISIFYYLKIITVMYFQNNDSNTKHASIQVSKVSYAAIIILFMLTLVLIFHPNIIFSLI